MQFEKYHENPQKLHIGTCQNRSYYIPFASGENEVTSSRVVSLNGTWNFRYEPSFCRAFPDFEEKGIETNFTFSNTISVPSCWQTQGYDRHQYANIRYPFPFDPPYVPEDNPCGLYNRSFFVSDQQKKMSCFLNFEGVDSCFYLWINGKFTGYSQVSHSTSEFEITDFITQGENQITVLVLKWCDGSYLEDQDKLRMSGIFRDVYLLFRPKNHIRDYFVHTNFNETFSRGELQIDLKTVGNPNVRISLISPDKKVLEVKKATEKSVTFIVENPLLWNAESPVQYELRLESEEECICQKVGFRKIETKGDRIFLNGVPIRFRGVNRHDSDPVTGYTISREQATRDLKLMKLHNINAIRTSHYPNAPWFPQLCSEYGFYLIGETDLECHGDVAIFNGGFHTYGNIVRDPQFEKAVLDRVQRNVERDKNCASIVIWSLGNESGYGQDLVNAGKWVKSYDTSRLLHYENVLYYDGDKAYDMSMLDVFSRMYGDPEFIDSYFASPDNIMGEGKRKPFFQCEFIHAMGNGPGGIQRYMEQMEQYPGFCGGFVWEWCDHAVYQGRTPDNRDRYDYGGDFGEFPSDGNFCVDGLVYPDRTPHTGLLEYKNAIRPLKAQWRSGKLFLKNCLDFTEASENYQVLYTALINGSPAFQGEITLPELLPHEEKEIKLPFLFEKSESILLRYITMNNSKLVPAGTEVGFDQLFPFGEPECPSIQLEKGGQIQVRKENGYIGIFGKNFHYCFDCHTGLFDSIIQENTAILNRPMQWNLWRAPTDNDQYIREKWIQAGFNRAKVRVYDCHWENNDGIVTIICNLSLSAVFLQRIININAKWCVDSNGRIKADFHCIRNDEFTMPESKDLVPLPRFGIRLFMPSNFQGVKYYAYGPVESYCDKYLASYLGQFSSTVWEQHEDYIRPQENGSHYGTRELNLYDDGMNFRIVGGAPFSFSVSPYTQEELETKKHNYELSPCGETVVCLDYKQNGIGSNSCGPEPEKKDRFDEKEFVFHLVMEGRNKSKDE